MAVDSTTLSVGGWDSDRVDSGGVAWTLTGLTGWWEPPGVKDNSSARPVGPGSFDSPVYDDARVLGMTERFTAPTPQALHAALVTMGSVRAALMGGATIVGHQPDGDYTVTAKAGSTWQVAAVGPLAFEYQWSATCRDPYKYGPPVQAVTGLPAPGGTLVWPLWDTGGVLDFGPAGPSGRVTLLNPGSVQAWPVFTVRGPLIGGFNLADVTTGSLVTFADSVPAGSAVVIDSASGQALLNGSDWSGSLVDRQWWPVAPFGGSTTVQFNALTSGQSGTATITLAPAYY
jgi:hypothetical protein